MWIFVVVVIFWTKYFVCAVAIYCSDATQGFLFYLLVINYSEENHTENNYDPVCFQTSSHQNGFSGHSNGKPMFKVCCPLI